eukprot:442831_1
MMWYGPHDIYYAIISLSKINFFSVNTITIKYQNKFKVQSFVNNLFKIIANTKEKVLFYQYKHLIELLYQNGNLKKKKKFITCIMARKKCNRSFISDNVRNPEFTMYSMKQTYTDVCLPYSSNKTVTHLDLYLTATKPKTPSG